MSDNILSAPKATKTPSSIPAIDDSEADASRERERRRALLATGRQSTLLTGGIGLEAPANTRRATIGGV